MFMSAGGMLMFIVAVALVLYLGVTTGLLGVVVGGLLSLLGSVCEAVGAAIGRLLAGLFTGLAEALGVIAVPALIIGGIALLVAMVWRAFFD